MPRRRIRKFPFATADPGMMLLYLKKIKFYFFYSIFIFLVFSLIGFLVSLSEPESGEEVTGFLFDFLEKIGFWDLSKWQMLLFVFLNNAIKIISVALLGFFFGIFPIFFIVANGMILGILAHHVSEVYGWFFFMAGIFPHGIIEIPAAIAGASVGLFLGHKSIKKIFLGESVDLRLEFKESLSFLLKPVLVLVFIAAVAEIYLTPAVIGLVN